MDEDDTANILLQNTKGTTGTELARLGDVPLELAVRFGEMPLTIRNLLNLKPGAVLTMQNGPGEPFELLLNGRPCARGEIVVVNDHYGIRITEVLE